MASINTLAVPFESELEQRATKFDPEASAMISGWNGLTPVPSGVSLPFCQFASVVGDAWPLVMP